MADPFDKDSEDEAARLLATACALSFRTERLLAALAEAAELRLPVYSLLLVVQLAGPQGISVTQAARRLNLRPQALANPAAELEALGLLRREIDAIDRRSRRLRMSPRGADRLATGHHLIAKLHRELKARVPASSVAFLVLERLDGALAQVVD